MSVADDMTPLDEALRKRRRRRIVVLAVIVYIVALYLAQLFNPNDPVVYRDIVDHFKYGSIGADNNANGIPYWIWKVLPEVFADKLPGEGYESLGFVSEGRDTPIGFSRRRVFVDRIGLNCSACHTGAVRDTPDSEPRVILGMPANTMDLQSYYRFLFACAADSRFTADNIMNAIARRTTLNPLERIAYRAAVYETRDQLMERGRAISIFMNKRPDWGPGRVDTFSPYKIVMLNWPDDGTTGTSDLPSLWNQRPRVDGELDLHWDGNNSSLDERNLSASMGAGTTPPTVDLDRLHRVRDWIMDLPPPAYPYQINHEIAAKGEIIYRKLCADCHAFGGSKVGRVTPVAAPELQTDRNRLDSYTYPLSANQNLFFAGYPWRFSHFRKTDGYTNMPLDGIWARAPYLHNGSVPTLADLLEEPQNRPKVFYRGYNVYDREKVGFVSTVAEENGRKFFKFDTSLIGNDNGGHTYGVKLTPDEKKTLVEYMKTL
ncbi:MAG TPA: cytochrome c [Blastocatellia bacterium]|nr:cytochrome c [Blastocatellia bacterium]